MNEHLVQDVVGFVQQNPPELGGGLAGVLLHAASNAVDVAQDVLQQPANTPASVKQLHTGRRGRTPAFNSPLLQLLQRLAVVVGAVHNLKNQ